MTTPTPAQADEKAREALIDQASRLMAAGWRGNPNMSGDDRDFMTPSMRRKHDEKVRSVVEFVLERASPPAPAGVKIKALRWVDQGKVPAEAWGDCVLRQSIGHHDLGRYAGSYCVQEREPGGRWGWWCTWTSDREPEGIEPNEAAAMAACQSHFDKAIRSALDIPPTTEAQAGSAKDSDRARAVLSRQKEASSDE